MASWMTATFGVECIAVRDLGLRDSTDSQIFKAAREAAAIVVSKDADFVRLLEQHGPPPQIVWVTCGNTSNQRLRDVIASTWPDVIALLTSGEALVELSERA